MLVPVNRSRSVEFHMITPLAGKAKIGMKREFQIGDFNCRSCFPNAKLTHGLPGGKREMQPEVAKARSLPKQDA